MFRARTGAAALVGVSAAFVVGLAVPSFADEPPTGSARVAQINRLREKLNHPDPTIRLVALEEALRSRDAVLRRVALSTSFASTDSDLRSVALADAVRTSPTIVVGIVGPIPKSWFLAVLGRNTEVRLSRFDAAKNTFQAEAAVSRQPRPGAVSGDRISLEFGLDRVGSSDDSCKVVATLRPGSPILDGDMNCLHNEGLLGSPTFHFDVAINILK